MRLCLFKTLWGVQGAGDPMQWDGILSKIAADGFGGVEFAIMALPEDESADALWASYVLANHQGLFTPHCLTRCRPEEEGPPLRVRSGRAERLDTVDPSSPPAHL